MGKASRKPRPSMPHWYWLGQDGCWFCKNRNNCNSCKSNREFKKLCSEKKEKGKNPANKKPPKKNYLLDEDE